MDVAKMLGDFLRTTRNVGMAVHYINGTIIFPLIFTWILWNVLFSQAVVTPIMGGGFFSAKAGGAMTVVAIAAGPYRLWSNSRRRNR